MKLDEKFGIPDKDGWYPFSTAPKNIDELQEVYGPCGSDAFSMNIILGREARLCDDGKSGFGGRCCRRRINRWW